MRRLALVLVLAVAGLALAGGVSISTGATAYQFRPCTGTGKPWDGGTTAGYRLPEGHYVCTCTKSECYVKFYDGGTAPDGCNDGGSCWTASIAYNGSDVCIPAGVAYEFITPRGGQGLACASDGGAWLDCIQGTIN